MRRRKLHLDSNEAGELATPASVLLTARQIEVLVAIAQGLSIREIAELLSVSVKTIESHRATIVHRTQLKSVAALTRYARRQGLIDA